MTRTVPALARHRLARVVTEISSPAICATAAITAVAVSDAGRSADAVWVSLAAVLVVAVPMGYIFLGVRRGKWADHHVGERTSRTAPLLVAVAGVAAATMLLSLADASRAVLAVVVAMLVGLLVVLVVTSWWKVSIHCAVAGGLLAVLVVTYGAWWLAAVPALLLVGWSRVDLDDHTPTQAAVGAALGALVAAVVFPTLR